MAYARPRDFVDGDNTKPADAAALHAMQDGVYSQAAAYADSVAGSGAGSVKTAPTAVQVVQPTVADVTPLAVRSHASTAQGGVTLESRDTDGTARVKIRQEGSVDVYQRNVFFPQFQAFNNAADTQPTFQINGGQIAFGPGGSSPADVTVTRSLYPATGVSNYAHSQLSYSAPGALNGVRQAWTGTLRLTRGKDRSFEGVPMTIVANWDNTNLAVDNPGGGEQAPALEAQSAYVRTLADIAPTRVMLRGLIASQRIGGSEASPVVAVGTTEALTAYVPVYGSSSGSENCAFVGFLTHYVNAPSRSWFTDFNQHSAPAAQMNLLGGISMFQNHYHNVSPINSPTYGVLASTQRGSGGGVGGTHTGANTFPLDVGMWVAGTSGTAAAPRSTDGYLVAFKAGHGDHPRTAGALGGIGGWGIGSSLFERGFQADDYAQYGFYAHGKSSTGGQAFRSESNAGASYFRGGVALGSGAGAAGGVPKAGAPVDSDFSIATDGLISLDTTGTGKLWARVSGVWRSVSLA